VDSSKIKKRVRQYNDAFDDYDAMAWGYCSENLCGQQCRLMICDIL
jgi:hypothetical protein